MEHVAQHHATRQSISGQLANYGNIPLIYLGGASGCSDSFAVPTRFPAIGRDNELEADALANAALARAGFDPEGLARYIGRVQPKQNRVFSPLQDAEMRFFALMSMPKQQPSLDYQITSAEFSAVRLEVEHLIELRDKNRPTLIR